MQAGLHESKMLLQEKGKFLVSSTDGIANDELTATTSFIITSKSLSVLSLKHAPRKGEYTCLVCIAPDLLSPSPSFL